LEADSRGPKLGPLGRSPVECGVGAVGVRGSRDRRRIARRENEGVLGASPGIGAATPGDQSRCTVPRKL